MDFSKLNSESVLLTPNRRLQEYWSEQYNLGRQHQGLAIWLEPPIYSFNQWLETLWEQWVFTQQNPICKLTDSQTNYIFEQLIRGQDTPLLNVTATAKSAIAAWNLYCAWDLNPLAEHPQDTEDTNWFRLLAQEFIAYCEQQQVKDAASSINEIISGLAGKFIKAPKQLFYSGFSEWTPQQQRLLTTLSKMGCEVIAVQVPSVADHSRRIGLANTEHEIVTAARWAKNLWQQGQQAIACVIPELAHCRTTVARIFREQFSDCPQFPVNITGGTPLATFPIIHTALLCFKLAVTHLQLTEIGSLLRSPYLAGGESERSLRACLEWALLETGEKQANREWLQQHIDEHRLPELARIISECYLNKDKATPRVWAKRFSDLLLALGWPGERELDSLEYQCSQRWLRLLDEFAALSQHTSHIDAQSAINLCQKLAASTMFQAQSAVEPIQVVGLLEAVGHPFAAIWIMGLHDEVWPASAEPNPFIPLALQRQHSMPHASAERELTYCQQLTQQFRTAAKQVYFSYPLQTDDRSNACSRLLLSIPEISLADLQLAPLQNRAKVLQASTKVAYFHDESAPPLHPSEIIRGGSAILKAMATCPFQAFARHRLGAKQPQSAALGLSGSERGLLIHRALEYFWQNIKTQANLLQLTETQLTVILEEAIHYALRPLLAKKSLRFSPQFFACERSRLHATLTRYLQLEKQRPPFTVIGIEKPITTTLAGMTFKLRIDRIDQTASGATVIIDYKTALLQISDWFSDRPTEPQLPLYAISGDEIHGLVIAQLKSHSIALQGISRDELQITGVRPLEKVQKSEEIANWQQQLEQWHLSSTLGS